MEALETDPEEVFAVLAEGIANTMDGVYPENVTVFDVIAARRRLLGEIEEIVRRLTSSIKVRYVIHIDNGVAQALGLSADTVAEQITANGAEMITQAFASNSVGYTFNFTLVVTSISADPPLQEIVAEEMVPTVTTTSTTTFSDAVSPLEQVEDEGATAAATSIIIALAILVIFLIACLVKCSLDRKKSKLEAPTLQIVEVVQEEEADLGPQQMLWHVESAADPRPTPITLAEVELDEELPTPILPDGTVVEYYSRTHNVWLPGTLQVVMRSGTLMSEPTVSYNVKVNTGGNRLQRRENVGLDSFRTPFAEGELVEVYSATGKTWLPATVATGYQGSSALSGYRLVVDETAGEGFSGRVLENVAAVRVRRRFEQGALVSRYLGPVGGFESGYAAEAAQDPGMEPAAWGSGVTGPARSSASLYSTAPLPAAPGDTAQAWDKDFEGAVGRPDLSESDQISQWSWIQYNGVDSSAVVPSYVLMPLAGV